MGMRGLRWLLFDFGWYLRWEVLDLKDSEWCRALFGYTGKLYVYFV